MLISIFCQIFLLIGGYILLKGLKLIDYFLDLLWVDAKIYGCRSDGKFILDDIYEFWFELLERQVKFLCWCSWGSRRKDLGLNLQYLHVRFFRVSIKDENWKEKTFSPIIMMSGGKFLKTQRDVKIQFWRLWNISKFDSLLRKYSINQPNHIYHSQHWFTWMVITGPWLA